MPHSQEKKRVKITKNKRNFSWQPGDKYWVRTIIEAGYKDSIFTVNSVNQNQASS